MKSRLVVTLMLVFGLVFSTAGVGMAVSGQSGSSDAAGVQYLKDKPKAGSDVLGEVGTVAEDEPSSGPTQGEPTANPAAGETPAGGETPAAQPLEQRQLTTAGEELPFTGLATVTLLVLGLALLTTGFVLRRRLADER